MEEVARRNELTTATHDRFIGHVPAAFRYDGDDDPIGIVAVARREHWKQSRPHQWFDRPQFNLRTLHPH